MVKIADIATYQQVTFHEARYAAPEMTDFVTLPALSRPSTRRLRERIQPV